MRSLPTITTTPLRKNIINFSLFAAVCCAVSYPPFFLLSNSFVLRGRSIGKLQPPDHRVYTLTQQVRHNNAKIGRMENFLMTIAGEHPFSQPIWNAIFQSLDREQDAELRRRLLRQMINGRPRVRNAWLNSPDPNVDNVDNSVRGVYERGCHRMGRNAPNSA